MPTTAATSRNVGAPVTLLTRRVSFTPSTANAEARTVRATISTGAGVERRDARGSFVEFLDLEAVDPATLVGLPVLDSHDQTRLENLVGVVDGAGRDAAGLWADIRISDRAGGVWGDIAAGIIRGCSLGYAVLEWRESTVSGRRTRTAVAWRILEISLVAVPADAGATLRSRPMPNRNETDVETIDRPENAEPTVTETRAAIRGIARAAGLPSAWADEQIDADATRAEAEAAAFREMQERSRRTPRIRTAAPAEDPTLQRRAMEDALVLRSGVVLPNDEARQSAARQFAGASLRDLARECVARAGVRPDPNPDQLFRAAVHSTSDFPALLTGAGQRTLLASYAAAASPLKTLARQGTRPDFRSGSAIRLGEVGRLEKVGEGGEIRHTSRAEAVASYALDTYASMFTLSRQALINDDLNAFSDWARAAGQAAASTEADLLWSLLSQSNGAGPIMGDGKRLFHADHGNLLTGAALSVTALSAARLALRRQTGLDGKSHIAVTPKYLLVGPELETTAEQVIATLAATAVEDVNPFGGRLTLLVEPRRVGLGWDLFADPAQAPVLEYSFLSSAPGPQVSQRDGWDVLAREFRVFEDFGCGAQDWRGAVRNPGA